MLSTSAEIGATGLLRDARGGHRWLRVTWHPAHELYVLSIWRDDVCAATFQLDRRTSVELITQLLQPLGAPAEVPWSEPRVAALRPRRFGTVLRRLRRRWP
jgi:hypothetical protein